MRIQSMSSGPAFTKRVPKVLALIIAVLVGLGAWQQATANAIDGSWDGPYCWPIGATHQSHLPPSGQSENGRILMWAATDNSLPIKAWLWHPEGNCFGQNPPNNVNPACFTPVQNNDTNLFCAGHTALADGTILTSGGHNGDISGADVGLADTNHFIRDSITGEWGDWRVFPNGIPLMAEPRWYPTVTTLPDGRAITMSGSDSACSNSGAPCANDAQCNGGTCDVVIIGTPEIYDPAVDPPGWTPMGVTAFLEIPFYPLNFVLPDGTLFYAGAEGGHGGATVAATETYVLDIANETWHMRASSPTVPGGSAVMYAPGKVFKTGGGNSVDGAVRIDMNIQNAVWQDVGPMPAGGRRRHQMTLLPDGTVLVTGGTRAGNREYMHACDGGTRTFAECTIAGLPPDAPGACPLNTGTFVGCPVACVRCGGNGECVGGTDHGNMCTVDTDCADNSKCDGGAKVGLACNEHDDCPGEHQCNQGAQVWVAVAEIYDPNKGALGTWTEVAAAKTPRMYHSSAMLLPDGRVVSAGGGPVGFGGAIHSYPTVEFYSPPYLSKGPAPEIADSPEAICYDTNFRMKSSGAVDVGHVTLLRLGTVTHSFDSDQRFEELNIADQEGDLFLVTAPLDANTAPPGYYMLFFLSAAEDVPSVGKYVQVVEQCCDPLSQGYWHRQCLGAGLITPGRNGRGPQTLLEPVFVKTLVPAVDARLQASIFVPPTFRTCEDGMDAAPPSDPCERALKQYTALLLNIESGRLLASCDIDLSAEGCNSTNVGDLVDELAALINSGDSDACKQAAACAGAVNEDEAIVEVILVAANSSSALSPLGDAFAMGFTEPTADAAPVEVGTSTLAEAPAPVVSTGSATSATGGTRYPQASEAAEHSTPPTTEATPMFMLTALSVSPEAPASEAEPRTEVSAPETSNARRSIDRHLAVLANASAPERARRVSEDALLTALGGGYEPNVRLQIARELLGKVDVAYHSILAKHLEDIRIEAQETGNEKVEKEAARLLKQLESTEESKE